MRTLKAILVKEAGFIEAWIKLLSYCIKNESQVIFGDKDNPKRIRGEICSRVILEGKAVEQIINGVSYLSKYKKVFPFGPQFIQHYVDEYSLEYIEKQASLPLGDKQKFTYTYYDRFRRYPTLKGLFDQVEALKNNVGQQIKSGIFSNRHQMITWIPEIDTFSAEPPCLQRVWISLIDKNCIEVHLEWRSRDLYGAWHVNLVAIINMINRDIAIPNNCKIVRVIDSCNSLHIYNGDFEQAKTAVALFN
ncbi:MAG: thymidylate synthase [Candidatus Pacebacteria bacterium]|nr:thymidylate synthase [Candidatus Paceibacterota bacterium]MDD4073956.1 thymidylate synthase [Candidatus Paceibacterota bacterium]